MSSNTKILVLRSKEVVYALVLLIVSVLIILVAVSLFMPSDKNTSDIPATPATETNTDPESNTEDSSGTSNTGNTYVPGIYSSTLQLGTSNIELQVTVDKDHINSITLTNIDEAVATLYPLMEPTLYELAAEIISEQSTENISYTDENRYTSMLLMQAITACLDKAKVSENADSPSEALSADKMQ